MKTSPRTETHWIISYEINGGVWSSARFDNKAMALSVANGIDRRATNVQIVTEVKTVTYEVTTLG